MKLYDISQEVFGCQVYPGDPAPRKEILSRISDGGVCNLSAFSMCAHNGTHIDAPFHFYKDGKTVSEVDLEKLVGPAYVAEQEGTIGAEEARGILRKAQAAGRQAQKRILLKGRAVVSAEAAEVFAQAGLWLLGNESQTVGPEDAPMEVHLRLLGAEVVLLEGIRLGHVPEGAYLLNAAPIHLGGGDGAPCRAILMKVEQEVGQ